MNGKRWGLAVIVLAVLFASGWTWRVVSGGVAAVTASVEKNLPAQVVYEAAVAAHEKEEADWRAGKRALVVEKNRLADIDDELTTADRELDKYRQAIAFHHRQLTDGGEPVAIDASLKTSRASSVAALKRRQHQHDVLQSRMGPWIKQAGELRSKIEDRERALAKLEVKLAEDKAFLHEVRTNLAWEDSPVLQVEVPFDGGLAKHGFDHWRELLVLKSGASESTPATDETETLDRLAAGFESEEAEVIANAEKLLGQNPTR